MVKSLISFRSRTSWWRRTCWRLGKSTTTFPTFCAGIFQIVAAFERDALGSSRVEHEPQTALSWDATLKVSEVEGSDSPRTPLDSPWTKQAGLGSVRSVGLKLTTLLDIFMTCSHNKCGYKSITLSIVHLKCLLLIVIANNLATMLKKLNQEGDDRFRTWFLVWRRGLVVQTLPCCAGGLGSSPMIGPPIREFCFSPMFSPIS